MMHRFCYLAVIVLLIACLVACSTWPTIIAAAQSIGAITSIFYPAVGAFSSLLVALLQQAQGVQAAYQKDKTAGTEQDFNNAILAIETRVPDELNKISVKIPAKDFAKVEAATTIVLDYVEAFGVQAPAPASTKAMVLAHRTARNATLTPKMMTRQEIKARWDAEVCQGDLRCTVLVH